MYYSIRHLTKFLYSNPVSESMMETRMHPRSDQNQRCLTFHLSVSPRCRVFSYRDHLSNNIHHFDIPGQHGQLVIVAESQVEVQPVAQVPAFLAPQAWEDLDAQVQRGDYWEMLLPSEFTAPTDALEELAAKFDVRRRDDPLMVLHHLNQQMYRVLRLCAEVDQGGFTYRPGVGGKEGRVPGFRAHHDCAGEDEAADSVPVCERISFPRTERHGPGLHSATHAWVEALLPQLGWVGFDPTNWLVAGDRHIRTAIGRDYADVPPTHGIFRGRAGSELTVAVRVTPSEGTPSLDQELPVPEDWSILVEKATRLPEQPPPLTRQQQMAQQQ